jgi:S1-C subfamily serine protease
MTGPPLTVAVVVKLVTPDRQAGKLGIQAGDLFTHYDGKLIFNQTHFTNHRNAEPAEGMAKELKVWRASKALTLRVSLGKLGVELENRMQSK